MLTDPSGLAGSSIVDKIGVRRAAIDTTRASSSGPAAPQIAL